MVSMQMDWVILGCKYIGILQDNLHSLAILQLEDPSPPNRLPESLAYVPCSVIKLHRREWREVLGVDTGDAVVVGLE